MSIVAAIGNYIPLRSVPRPSHTWGICSFGTGKRNDGEKKIFEKKIKFVTLYNRDHQRLYLVQHRWPFGALSIFQNRYRFHTGTGPRLEQTIVRRSVAIPNMAKIPMPYQASVHHVSSFLQLLLSLGMMVTFVWSCCFFRRRV